MKIDSHLEDRAFLDFTFFDGYYNQVDKRLDFAENVRIRETAASRLTTYQPVGRNGSVYVHLGSDSRKFSLDFNITLPHILLNTQIEPDGLSPLQRYEKKKEIRDQYVQDLTGSGISQGTDGKDMKSYIRTIDALFTGYLDDQEKLASVANLLGGSVFSVFNSGDEYRIEALAKVMFWMNLIRSSTMTHSGRPHYGPPLVRLNHGIVYQNVPCIVNNYSINIDGEAGYDNKTLMPRLIKVSLNLSEVRVSSTKDFTPVGKGPAEFDREVGWDTVVDGFVSLNRITDGSITTEEQE